MAPAFAGLFMQDGSFAALLVAGAAMKITYDLLLWRAFRSVRPPEEQTIGHSQQNDFEHPTLTGYGLSAHSLWSNLTSMPRIASVSLYQAKTQLSHLVDRAVQGHEIVITRHGRPVARLVPVVRPRSPRRLGALRGKIRVAPDFDAPLPDDLLALFEGEGR